MNSEIEKHKNDLEKHLKSCRQLSYLAGNKAERLSAEAYKRLVAANNADPERTEFKILPKKKYRH